MTEWITGGLVLAAVLGVGYRYALPIAGSLYRRARLAHRRRKAIRRLAKALDLPPAILKLKSINRPI